MNRSRLFDLAFTASLISLFIILLMACDAADPRLREGTEKVEMVIAGLDCQECPGILAKSVYDLGGILMMRLEPDIKLLTLYYDSNRLSVDQIKTAISEIKVLTSEGKIARFKVLETR